MAKFFGEINLQGKIRIAKKSFSKLEFFESETSKIPAEKVTTSVTSSTIMDRIYVLPKLKKNQLEMAIQQKIKKDLEFIANISDIEWIFSVFPENNTQLRVLVSIIKKDELSSLVEFKALTTSSQVLSNFLFKKSKEDFLLVHSFNEDYLILVFRRGSIDYLRGFKSESPIEESIELALEYYKDQHKVDIKKILYSGDIEIKAYPGKEIFPIEEFLKLKIQDRKFIVPFALGRIKAPFFYRKTFLKPVHIMIPLSLGFASLGTYIYFQEKNLETKIETLQKRLEILERKIEEKESEISKLENKKNYLNKFLNNPTISHIFQMKKIKIYEFIKSLEQPLKLTRTHILSISGNKDRYTLSTITFCKNINTPKELNDFIKFIKENNYVEEFKIINAEKLEKDNAIITEFKIKLRGENYVQIN